MLLTIGASIIPMLLVSGIILLEFHASYDEKVRAHLSELVLKHKQNIDSFLQAKLGDIRVLARTFTFEKLSREELLEERLATLQQEYEPVMVDLGVINAKGTQVAYAGPFKLGKADYSDAEWFLEAMQREYFISDVFRGLRGLPHFIVAVRSACKGEPWILRATIDFVAFNNLVENIRIGETGFAFILNRKGDFQTKPPAAIRLEKEVFLRFFEAKTGHGEDLHVLRLTDEVGGENIYVTALLKNDEWLLVYRQNAADAYSGFRNTLRMTLTAIGIIALGIVALAFVRWRRINQQLGEEDQERQMMNKQIVETGKLAAVGELAAGIAHEINNPVAIMVEEAGWVEDLLEDEDPEKIGNLEEFARALRHIREQGRRCKQITHKLLSFARKTDSRVQEVILYDLVEQMVALSAQRAKYGSVEIVTDLEPGLPSLRVSLSEMQQVLLNLINNALDAMEKTSGTIHITARLEGKMITICVADTGPGIPESNLEKIFEPFFTTKPVGKGTGLGLSICYGIITKLGGDIEVRSELGVGTTFRIQIPLQPVEAGRPSLQVDT